MFVLASQTGVFSGQIRTGMRDRRLRIGVLRRSRMPPFTPVPPGAQPRSGNPQLLRNLAQRPAAAHQQPNRLPLEFIRVLTTRCTHQTPSCSQRSLSEVSIISREGQFRGNSRSDWFFAFLDAFPTPASIMALSKAAFIEAAWDVVGRKVSKERLLADIYETARTSIGLPLPIDAPAIRMFRMVIAEARSLIRQRNEIEDMAAAMLRDSADYKALRKVPGIGPVIALTIGRRRRSQAFPSSPPIPEVLRAGSFNSAIRPTSRADAIIK